MHLSMCLSTLDLSIQYSFIHSLTAIHVLVAFTHYFTRSWLHPHSLDYGGSQT